MARVRAVLRRAPRQARPAAAVGDPAGSTLRVGDLELDEDHWTVQRAGTPVELSPTEFRLLAYLMRNQGLMLTRKQLLENVWGWELRGQSQVLETYVSYLRRKLDPLGPPLIHTQRGVGYSLRPRDPARQRDRHRRHRPAPPVAVPARPPADRPDRADRRLPRGDGRGHQPRARHAGAATSSTPIKLAARQSVDQISRGTDGFAAAYLSLGTGATGVLTPDSHRRSPRCATLSGCRGRKCSTGWAALRAARAAVRPDGKRPADAAGGLAHGRRHPGRPRRQRRHAAGPAVILLGRPASDISSQVSGLVLAELITGGALLALLAVCGNWLIGRALAPLRRMASTADLITSNGDLTARMPDPDDRQEIGRLAGAINTMLDRIQQAFGARLRSEQKVRQFAADASHELRTPLTTIRGYAELYRQGALGPASCPTAMRRIEQEADRMCRLVAELLELARLDRETSLDLTETDLPRSRSTPWPTRARSSPTARSGPTSRAPGGHRRRAADPPGAGEPARQRPRAHAARHPRHRPALPGHPRRRPRGLRRRARACPTRTRPGRSTASTGAPGRRAAPTAGQPGRRRGRRGGRKRPRPVHRPGDRGRARRLRPAAVRARRRHDRPSVDSGRFRPAAGRRRRTAAASASSLPLNPPFIGLTADSRAPTVADDKERGPDRAARPGPVSALTPIAPGRRTLKRREPGERRYVVGAHSATARSKSHAFTGGLGVGDGAGRPARGRGAARHPGGRDGAHHDHAHPG